MTSFRPERDEEFGTAIKTFPYDKVSGIVPSRVGAATRRFNYAAIELE